MSLKTTQSFSVLFTFLFVFALSAFSFSTANAQDCEDGTNAVDMILTSPVYGDGAYGMVYTISLDGETVATGSGASGNWDADTTSLCLVDGCYDVVVSDAFCCNLSYGWEFMGASGEAGTGATVSVGASGCVTGCTDAMADNYNPDADISDNTLCEYSVLPGCMDVSACNYNPDAGQDDGSCTFAEAGYDCLGNCLEGTLTTINVQEVSSWGSAYSLVSYGGYWDLVDLSTDASVVAATSDDESLCLPDGCYEISGMSGSGSSYAFGYDLNGEGMVVPGASGEVGSDIIDLGSSCVTGCTDEAATNFDATAHISDNSLCEYAFVQGCTDMTACNYDPAAEQDNGSCESAPEGFDCDGNCLSGSLLTITLSDSYGDGWNGNSLTVDGVDYTQVESYSWPYTAGASESFSACVDLAVCMNVTYNATGSYAYENSWSVSDADGTVLSSGADEDGFLGDCPSGCTDPLANNFDTEAVVDNGFCVYCVDGEEVSELPAFTLPDDVITVTIQTGASYPGEIHWELVSDASSEVLFYGGGALEVGNTSAGGTTGGNYEGEQTYTSTSGCLPHGCYKLVTYDTWGDGWNDNGSFTVTNQFDEVLVPQTVMSPTSGNDPDGTGYGSAPQELATYFTIGEGSCDTYGCTDPAASNYNSEATVDDQTCIFCEEGEIDVTFVFNQENITTDEVFVYNETDTVFSVTSGELSTWEGKEELICVPVGCYNVSMASSSTGGWTDGSQLQILDDLTAEYFFLDVDGGSLDIAVVSLGGGECIDDQIGGCTDIAYDNYNPDATFDNGTCAFLCENATAGNTSTAVAGDDDTFGPWVYVCADAEGNGAEVTFEEMADGVTSSYIAYNVDSCEGPGSSLSFLSSTFSVDLDPGQCVYFQAQNPYNYVDSVSTIMATVFEIPDSSTWGCMDELACNYDVDATYQPDAACEYAVAGFDCDSVQLPAYLDVELDYSASHSLCADDNDFDATNTSYDGSSTYVAGEDMAFAFVSDGSSVMSSVVANTTNYSYVTIHIYEGYPTDSATLVASDQLVGYDLASDIIFETVADSTYYVIVDTYGASWANYCYDFDISLTALVGQGGCTDPAACNYDADATYDDLTCVLPADGFDCDGLFTGSACGTDNPFVDSVAVPYDNNMYEVWTFPSNGVDPVSIVFTSGDTEGCCDDWRIYDGVGDDAISFDNLIVEFNDVLANSYASGNGNGITVVWDTDGSVNGDETYGNMIFEVYCAYIVPGCIDTLAVNYSADATIDDGSCEYDIVFGCMDESAINYNADAQADDGSCLTQGTMVTLPYSGTGLTNCGNGDNLDETNTSYSSWYMGGEDALFMFEATSTTTVNIDLLNGSDSYSGVIVFDGNPLLDSDVVGQSTSSSTDESISSMPVDSGNTYYVVVDSWPSPFCISSFDLAIYADVEGCTDGNAENFDETATIDDGSCEYALVQGCTDPSACNFDELAEQDNGSCEYPVLGFDCDGNFNGSACGLDNPYMDSVVVGELGYDNNMYEVWTFPSNGVDPVSILFTSGDTEGCCDDWRIYDGIGDDAISFDNLIAEFNDTLAGSFAQGNGNGITVLWDTDGSVNGDETYGNMVFEVYCADFVYGCTDELASNYDATANTDDGSCTYDFVWGCTDPLATNYDADAAEDDGSCEYPLFIDISLPFINSSLTTCGNGDDYTSANTSYSGNYLGGEDLAYAFEGTGNSVQIDMTTSNTYTGVIVFDGDPTSGAGVVASAESSFSSGTQSILLETSVGVTYYVVMDSWPSPFCYDFSLSIVEQVGEPGCTDEAASNYDPDASYDDGSCTYPTWVDVTLPYESSALTNCGLGDDFTSTNTSYSGSYLGGEDAGFGFAGTGTAVQIEMTTSDTYTSVIVFDGDPIAGASVVESSTSGFSSGTQSLVVQTVEGTDYVVVMDSWPSPFCYDFTLSIAELVSGCTDPLALNYNDLAVVDDGSCEYDFVWGCIEETACNYDPLADEDDGSCTFADAGYDCDGNCVADADGDLICDEFEIPGCTDETATNFDGSATDDDGSCIACTDNSVMLSMFDSYGDGWNGATFSMTDGTNSYSSDGITSYSDFDYEYFCVPTGCYDIIVSGGNYDYEISFTIGDFAGTFGTFSDVSIGGANCNPVFGCTDAAASNFNPEATDDDGSCEYAVFGCTDETADNYNADATDDDGSCEYTVLGCTDPAADNFDPLANTDDGSCTFCSDFSAVLIDNGDVSEAGASDGYVQATGQGGSSNYDVQVLDANGSQQNPFALAAGDYTVVVSDVTNNCSDELAVTIGEPAVAVDPCDITPSGLSVDNIIHNRVVFNWSAPAEAPSYYMIRYRPVGTTQWTVMRAGPETPNAFTGTSRTRYFHEAATTYEWSMRARMVDEDLATICQSPWSASAEYTTLPQCANLENLAVDNVEANWVTFLADAPDASWGVWQSKGKMREVGTNAYRYVNGGADGTIAGVLKGNFTASTDYEWHTKAWCTANVDENGNPDPMYHSGWGDFSAFTTEAPCDKLPTNLTTSSNGANTAVTMSWDTPESGAPDHYFLEMTNLTTGDVYEWNYQDGNSNSRTKFGQNPGDEISWRIRGACGSNGTSWATIFTQPVTYTLGGARLASDVVSQLDVYPNPSRDIFNVTFTSEEAQTISVKVVNMIGEEIYTEELTDFVGQYTKVVDMNAQPKGVYFLEITTNNGAINHKIVLQ